MTKPTSTRRRARKRADPDCDTLEQRYPLALEHIQEYAIFMTEPDGLVCTWNAGVERVLGYAKKHWLEKSGSIIFTPEDRARGEPEREMAQARKRGKVSDDRWHLRRDGSLFWASGVMTAESAADGTFLGFCKVLRDNTDRKEFERLKADFAGQKETQAALAAAIDTERRRLGRELHDGICQELLGTALIAGAAAGRVDDREWTKEQLRIIEANIRTAAQHAREIASGLHPVALCHGLAFALGELAEGTDGTVRCTFTHQGKVWLPAAEQLNLYRIAQESIANAVKHGESKQIDMHLIATAKSLTLIVSDDGKGFDPRRSPRMGLQNLRARAEALDAELVVFSETGKGTRITCTVQRKRGR